MPKYTDIYDQSLPVETKIYFSKSEAIGGVIAGIVAFGAGCYFFTNSSFILGITLSLIGVFLIYNYFKIFKSVKPQIIISHAGIRITTSRFRSWNEITNERLVTEQSGRYPTTYLVYNVKNEVEKISITGLDVDKEALQNLLIAYRKRSSGNIHK